MPQVLGYFTVGTTVLVIVTIKHIFADGVAVPVAAPISQGAIALLSGYLWYKNEMAVNEKAG